MVILKLFDYKNQQQNNYYFFAYQEGAKHVESDKINDGESAATRHLLPGVVV